ncbi:hypothetical protein JQN58_19190 [Aneurinibacillus sp. BA2021]|nr:hypothetical protein [Aneurinibacillus sp. BA2021]
MMKKTALCLMSLAALTGCTNNLLASPPAPPLPVLTVGERTVAAFQNSYCWSGKKSCVDFISPVLQVRTESPVPVPSAATLDIRFATPPKPGTLHVYEWIGDNKTMPVEVQNSTFTLAKNKGIHIYSLSAEWDEGSAYYVCKVYTQ